MEGKKVMDGNWYLFCQKLKSVRTDEDWRWLLFAEDLNVEPKTTICELLHSRFPWHLSSLQTPKVTTKIRLSEIRIRPEPHQALVPIARYPQCLRPMGRSLLAPGFPMYLALFQGR
jgi:hypothetical protein